MAWFYCLIEKGRMYSSYSKNIIHGDPKSLYWLADSIATGWANRQMQRVTLALQALDITFQHHSRQEMEDVDSLSKFAINHRGSRKDLERFLATDKPVVENTLIAAVVVMEERLSIPGRLASENEHAPCIAVPAGLGPNSPPGVPIDITAEQKLDPVCRFIVMFKRAEFPRIKSCPLCAKGKRRTIAGHGTAQHMGLVPTKYPPFERVVDLIGPLPESREGMKYILVSVDAHSSETKLAALKSRNSEDIANLLLEHIVLKEGCPKSWQSDRAPELIAEAVAKLATIAGIEAKACSAY